MEKRTEEAKSKMDDADRVMEPIVGKKRAKGQKWVNFDSTPSSLDESLQEIYF